MADSSVSEHSVSQANPTPGQGSTTGDVVAEPATTQSQLDSSLSNSNVKTEAPSTDGQPGGIASATVDPAPSSQGMSANEIALYDRQIRLWGKQAQEKIRNASVLLIGLKGLGNEIAKNLVLSGIGSLTIVENEVVTEDDLGAQFLVSEEDIGVNRAQAAFKNLQAMNPRVKLFTVNSSAVDLALRPAYFETFSIVIATNLTIDVLQPLNAACRLSSRPFYAVDSFGFFGYIFADLVTHTFRIERNKSNIPAKLGMESSTRTIIDVTTNKADDGTIMELLTKVEQYSPLSQVVNAPLPSDRTSSRRRRLQISPALACIRALWRFQLQTARPYPEETREDLALFTTIATNEHKNVLGLPHETLKSEALRTFLQGVSCEINPTCAMLGGVLAQDVINVIGQIEQPIQNLTIWDGEELSGEIYAMHSPPINPTPMTIPIQSVPIHMPTASNGGENGTANGGVMGTVLGDAPPE